MKKGKQDMALTVKRSKDRKTKIACGGVELWIGKSESYIRGDLGTGDSSYLKTTRETFSALLECCRAAIEEIDFLEQEEIRELEERLAQLKSVRNE